jgi:hypothetical protein
VSAGLLFPSLPIYSSHTHHVGRLALGRLNASSLSLPPPTLDFWGFLRLSKQRWRMGRRPDQEVAEYFERGPKLQDSSNRYEQTCKKCGEVFPKGRSDNLRSHLRVCLPSDRERNRSIDTATASVLPLSMSSSASVDSRSSGDSDIVMLEHPISLAAHSGYSSPTMAISNLLIGTPNDSRSPTQSYSNSPITSTPLRQASSYGFPTPSISSSAGYSSKSRSISPAHPIRLPSLANIRMFLQRGIHCHLCSSRRQR